MSRNLIARIVVAAIFIPLILFVSLEGEIWLFGMLAIFAGLAIGEYLTQEKYKPLSFSFIATAITTILIYWALSDYDFPLQRTLYSATEIAAVILLAYFLLTGMAATLRRKEPADLFRGLTRLVWGVIYVGVLYAFVFRLGDVSNGKALIFLFALLWVGDTAAMWVGKSFGKHKLAPTVSPNKTVEGFVGGLLFAVVTSVVVHLLHIFPEIQLVHLLVMGVGSSLFGQLGDMVESLWKRSLNIKDSSHIIPGHGGILDRFDSLLFAAPFMYFYLLFLH